MTQDDRWNTRLRELMIFIETNKRNPSRYDDEERGLYVNWLRHNQKLFNSGEMKPERVECFERLLSLCEENKRVNQYV